MKLLYLFSGFLAACGSILFSCEARALDVYALGAGAAVNQIVKFDSASPGSITATPVSGLTPGDTLVGIDFRPANGVLYGAGVNGDDVTLYTINTETLAATTVGSATVNTITGATSFGIDFNPVVDRLRVVNNLASDGAGGNANNFRLNPNDGSLVQIDDDLDYSGLPGGNSDGPEVAVAYANNFSTTGGTTTLFGLVSGGDLLVTNGGAAPGFAELQSVGTLGVDTDDNAGLDIVGPANQAFAVMKSGGISGFYTVDLSTGAATLVGAIGTGTIDFSDIAVFTDGSNSAPPETGIDIYGLIAGTNQISRFDSSDPANVTPLTITGLAAGDVLVGIDYRPVSGQLYGLAVNGDTTRLYTINSNTAVATPVGEATVSTISGATVFGVDFDPTLDQLRVVTNLASDGEGGNANNFRINAANGALVAIDADLDFSALSGGNANAPEAAIAHTNNASPPGGTTTLYGIATGSSGASDLLVTNGGSAPGLASLQTVGNLGVNSSDNAALDIIEADNKAFAILQTGGVSRFYTINLATGAATLAGNVGTGSDSFIDIAAVVALTCNGVKATMTGTIGNDNIVGTDGDDVIVGRAGDDIIDGGGGNDLICGDEGNDTLSGGSGNDQIFGNAGNDTISGGDGADTLVGGEGDDTIMGDAGQDTIFGDEGNDIINGGTENDTLAGGPGNDTIKGGSGDDLIMGGDGNDILRGERGRDRISGGPGNDNINGGPDDDTLAGNEGNDRISGGGGRDKIQGGKGNDSLRGGAGRDTCTGGPGTDTARACERVRSVP